jgi:hypothetical protein
MHGTPNDWLPTAAPRLASAGVSHLASDPPGAGIAQLSLKPVVRTL